ncbi:MAG: type II toxin-antitoxin system ParD family antitoxin [Chthoniobacterales bacterium]
MTTVAITLKDEDERFIDEAVKSGSYVTKSEVVAMALDLLKMREEFRKARRTELKKQIQKGISELERDEVVEFETKSFLAEMRTKHAAKISS